MKKVIFKWLSRIVATCATSVVAMSAMAESVEVTTPGTLSTVLSSSATDVAISGSINGSDVKYLRQLINEGNLTSVDLSKTAFASGGDAYYGEFTTKDGEMPEAMFTECSNLQSIVLPTSVEKISKNACSKTGLTSVVIPDNIKSLGMDAFAYCPNLTTATIGKRVERMEQGVFYQSGLTDVYVKPLASPSIGAYEFSNSPNIHVYDFSLIDYQGTEWVNFGGVTGDLAEKYPVADKSELFADFFEDYACTSLKAKYAVMSDNDLKTSMESVGIPEVLKNAALKIKNGQWSPYEKDFRICNYKAFSDADDWHSKLLIHSGSYMGNPTGIYSATDDTIYVFVDQDVPADATLYFVGKSGNNLITYARSGTRLVKGWNKIRGNKDYIYYVVYTADNISMTKKITEWPNIKIHIEGGVVNGYYDVARHSDADYQAILANATYEKFTVKGQYTAMHFNTETYRKTWPTTIDKSVARFDSLLLWQYELAGITEFVANGACANDPHHLTGGDAFFPSYYNNIHWAMEGVESDAGYANANPYRTSYNSLKCVDESFNVDNENMGEWCVAHEVGHTNQKAINLEGCTEVSNNLFSNVILFLDGRTMSSGFPVSYTMNDYAKHTPFVARDISSRLRMYYQLYLYYHQAQHNTSFYPNLFKALREDPLQVGGNTKNSSLKFVRKVCEVAQEDLTDFFKAWGFFEPIDTTINDYGSVKVLNEQAEIDATLDEIAQYPKKNRQILFIEDRIEYLKTTDFLTTAGKNRKDSDDKVGSCGDLGQFTDYLSGASVVPSYVYGQADNAFGMEGTGGVGFIVLDENGELLYASNNKSFELTPEIMNKNFVIKAVDAEGNLYDVQKVEGGVVNIALTEAGTLCEHLTTHTVKATISGPLNGTDVNCLRQKINENVLMSLDLSEATFVSGGETYGDGYQTSDGVMSKYMFSECSKLKELILPKNVDRIETNVCSHSGISNEVVISDNVTTVGMDAFAYCKYLTAVTVGEKVESLSQGVFWSSPVKDAYVKPLTPPTLASYMFSTDSASLLIHVYKEAYEDYVASEWSKYGTIVADLDELEKHDTIIDIDEVACDELLKNVEVMSWGGTLVDVPIHDKNGEEISIKFYDSANTLQAAYPDYAETQLMNGPIGEEDAYVHHLCLYQTAGLSYGQEYRITAMVGDKNCDARFSLEKGIYTASQARTAEDEGIRYVSATQSEIYVEFVSDSDSDAEISYYSTSGRQSGSKSVKVQKGVNSLTVDAQNILPNNSYVLNLSKEGVKYGKTFIVK